MNDVRDPLSGSRNGGAREDLRRVGDGVLPVRPGAPRWLGTVCAILAATVVAGCGEAGLSESSTCKDFLAADPADQQSITQQLAGKFGKPDYATPLGMPAVPYYCARHPDTTLQEFFESAG